VRMFDRSEQGSLALIGGYGRMGRWILRFLSEEGILGNLSVSIIGPREEEARSVAEQYACSYSTTNRDACRSKYVVVCTPLNAAASVVEEVAPLMKEGSVLMDICSVKSHICSTARKVVPAGVEYVSVHPMFGPSVKNLEGQVVLIVPVTARGFAEFLRDFLVGHQARALITTSDEHDYALGVVQCLTHFLYLAVGTTLREMGFDIKASRNFSSPVYELMLDMIGRILSGDPKMYAEIQMSNPYSAEIEDRFLKNASRLKSIVDRRDVEGFSSLMVEAAKHYDDLESASSKSGRAVSALYEELVRIKGSVGKRVAIRNEATGAVHVGTLKEITSHLVRIGDGKRVVEMKTANASLLPAEEAVRLRLEKYGRHLRDVSFLFDEEADPVVMARLLESYDDDLVSVVPTDVYTGAGVPTGRKSITFRLTFVGDLDPEKCEKRVAGLIRGMGARER